MKVLCHNNFVLKNKKYTFILLPGYVMHSSDLGNPFHFSKTLLKPLSYILKLSHLNIDIMSKKYKHCEENAV